MARMRFTLGTRYVLQGQVYIVRQVLVDNRLLVENQSFGGQFTVTQKELYDAWARDELRFEVHGPNTQRRSESSLATSYTFADFQHLSVKLRNEAWRRYQFIRPLLLCHPQNEHGKPLPLMPPRFEQRFPAQRDPRRERCAQRLERQSAAPALSVG